HRLATKTKSAGSPNFMTSKPKNIPIRPLNKALKEGLAVTTSPEEFFTSEEVVDQSHRHDYHFFVLQEKGVLDTEIDFERFVINQPTIFYQSPKQVHRIIKMKASSTYVLILNTANITTELQRLLREISPAKPLTVAKDDLAILKQCFSLCLSLDKRKEKQMSFSTFKSSCETLINVFISIYDKRTTPRNNQSRFARIERRFTALLEENFTTLKRPADYADLLNISRAYLNECVKNTTGYSEKHQIQEREILEDK